ncbi:MAG: sorbosone dehydrogenase family protein [Halobacteriales archaeon]
MSGPTRRRLLRIAGPGILGGLAGCGSESPATSTAAEAEPDTPDTTTDGAAARPEEVGLEPLVQGLKAPVGMAFHPDGGRRYVIEQPGLVLYHDADGLADEPALDLQGAVTAGGERGLLGIALHPDFAENRRLYLRYSAPNRAGTPEGYSHTFVLAEFEAAADGRHVRKGSERTVLEIPQPQGNHNAGDIAFGPDGYLYVAVGDGGAGGDLGDGHVDDWYGANGGGNGQDVTDNLLGSLLRIDVDRRGADRGYGIPPENPLVGQPGRDEHYAWGLRNPWRFAFDGETCYAADVGQNRFEEVNRIERGGNYGWNVKEGTHCFGAETCPDRTPDDVRGGEPLVDPVIEYPHRGEPVSGISVIGGNVYRGNALPGLVGTYVFGDLQAGGKLFTATPAEGSGLWSTRSLPIAESDSDRLTRLFSLARDADGKLYVLGVGSRGGGVHRLTSAE